MNVFLQGNIKQGVSNVARTVLVLNPDTDVLITSTISDSYSGDFYVEFNVDSIFPLNVIFRSNSILTDNDIIHRITPMVVA